MYVLRLNPITANSPTTRSSVPLALSTMSIIQMSPEHYLLIPVIPKRNPIWLCWIFKIIVKYYIIYFGIGKEC